MKKPIEYIKIAKGQKAGDLARQFSHAAFGARKIGEAADLSEVMIKERLSKIE